MAGADLIGEARLGGLGILVAIGTRAWAFCGRGQLDSLAKGGLRLHAPDRGSPRKRHRGAAAHAAEPHRGLQLEHGVLLAVPGAHVDGRAVHRRARRDALLAQAVQHAERPLPAALLAAGADRGHVGLLVRGGLAVVAHGLKQRQRLLPAASLLTRRHQAAKLLLVHVALELSGTIMLLGALAHLDRDVVALDGRRRLLRRHLAHELQDRFPAALARREAVPLLPGLEMRGAGADGGVVGRGAGVELELLHVAKQ
mmetsp:Transcript_32647/g.86350  ORF Transcript_32647/g.86350 Transcript_32647/m.86350 type:complete len:255 (+) Transcript_32647:736-1500(+)